MGILDLDIAVFSLAYLLQLLMGPFLDSSRFTSQLPQEGFVLLVFGGCGAMFALPFLAFVSFAVGWVVYELRKKRVDSAEAKVEAIIIAIFSVVLLVGALVAYFFHDLYIP
jgi:hypothetical protein